MKTVGDKLEAFVLTGVKPGQPEDAFFPITEILNMGFLEVKLEHVLEMDIN
jgi:hypothetical protein